jgi:hypothetical protein
MTELSVSKGRGQHADGMSLLTQLVSQLREGMFAMELYL